jgi:hypothetical protein
VFEDQEPAAVVADDTPHYKPLFVQPNITDIIMLHQLFAPSFALGGAAAF